MLKLSNVDVFRGETQVLWDITLDVNPGERVAIIGSNGAGKSSLLATITGGLAARGGQLTFKGTSLAGLKPYQITQLGLALVPEGRHVYPDMTVKENLEIGAYPKRGRALLAGSMADVMDLFPVLKARKHQRAGTLSGGEQQMLAVGRALMSRPELLLIDELSLGLAPLVTKQIYSTLAKLGREITILLVEQNVEQAMVNSQRAYILESGHLTRTGLSSELIADPDIRRAYLGI